MGVCVLLGSKSDLEKAEKAFQIFRDFNVEYEVHIASAHRTPERVKEIVEKTEHEVFLVFAGLSAALSGAVAALTTRPVIGVPLSGKVPLDSLLSMVQMPKGVPVGVVGVDNAVNGALLCIEILALRNEELKNKLKRYRETQKEKVLRDDEEVQKHV
ncbi:MAG: 5-(carboxyamino)imidazole ribonucleotide mutase [Thermoplasmata archaeon]|nr:5-(carboxyamino)imidazole ribonucleotide mutase [Thermoplasmata archaeon]